MSGYIRSLDGVRALAILLVMLFHFYYVLEIGWIGVQIFFVLSGYLITKILISSKEKANLNGYLKRFYWRRTVRIFPLYYTYLFIVTLIFLITGKPGNFGDTAAYLYTYTYNIQPLFSEFSHDAFFTHFWSLCVEEQFYLFWPLLIYSFNTKQTRVMIIVLSLFVPVFRLFFGEWLINQNYNEVGEILYRFTFSHFDAFAWGGAIAVFSLNKIIKPFHQKRILIVSLILFIISGVLNYIYLPDGIAGPSSIGYPIGGMNNYQSVWSYTLLNFFSASLIMYLVTMDNKKTYLGSLFKNKFAVQIGRISYGMYVYHWAALSFHKNYLNPIIGNMMISFVVYFVLVFTISWISFYTLEKFFLRLKETKFQFQKRYFLKGLK